MSTKYQWHFSAFLAYHENCVSCSKIMEFQFENPSTDREMSNFSALSGLREKCQTFLHYQDSDGKTKLECFFLENSTRLLSIELSMEDCSFEKLRVVKPRSVINNNIFSFSAHQDSDEKKQIDDFTFEKYSFVKSCGLRL